MDGYPYAVPPQFQVPAGIGVYPGSGDDGYADYYEMMPPGEYAEPYGEASRGRKQVPEHRTRAYARSRSGSRSRSYSRSRSRSKTDSRTRTKSRSISVLPPLHMLRKPSFLDSFRVLYLTPSKHSKSTEKYLSTKKHQDHIQTLLKSDGLGSKRWLFYPRSQVSMSSSTSCEPRTDNRIKVEADFFKKYKSSKSVDSDVPISKLKRWELILYQKLGFLQQV